LETNFSVTKPASTIEQCQVKSRKCSFILIKICGYYFSNSGLKYLSLNAKPKTLIYGELFCLPS
jgi:hypothetical protein